jgi:hypothetical protein
MITSGIKAVEHNGNKYIVLHTSNNFEDVEREIFTQQSWKEYVARRTKEPKTERVWFWHVPGSDYATIEWQDIVDHMLVEVAKIDNTARGEKMFEALNHPERFPELLPQGWGTSHGYWYNTADKETGVYQWVDKFETTTLPKHRASNKYGGLKGVIDMAKLTPEKEAALKQLLGDEEASKIISAAEKESADLEGKGISFKEEETEEAEHAEQEGSDEQMFELELDDDALTNIAERVPVAEAVKEALDTSKAEWVKEIAAALKEPIVALVAEAVKAQMLEVVGAKEHLVQQAVSGTLKVRARAASKEETPKDNELLDILQKAMEKGSKATQERESAEKAAQTAGMDLLDQALWNIRHGNSEVSK